MFTICLGYHYATLLIFYRQMYRNVLPHLYNFWHDTLSNLFLWKAFPLIMLLLLFSCQLASQFSGTILSLGLLVYVCKTGRKIVSNLRYFYFLKWKLFCLGHWAKELGDLIFKGSVCIDICLQVWYMLIFALVSLPVYF